MEGKNAVFIFDVDGVLNSYSKKAYMDYVVGKSKLPQEKAIILYKTAATKLSLGQVSLKSFELTVNKELGVPLQEIRWLKYYTDNAKPNKEMMELLVELRKRGNVIALMSNEDRSRHRIIQEHFLKLVDMSFVSGDMKLMKPNPLAYRYVVDEIGKSLGRRIEYKDVVFVDDQKANVEAAATLGIKAYHFTNAAALREQLKAYLGFAEPEKGQFFEKKAFADKRPKLVRDLIVEYYRHAPDLAPEKVEEREFGVGTPERKIMFRHLNFKSEGELKKYVISEAPQYISYSAAYYRFPAGRPMTMKGWLGAELVFDLDATDMNLPCQMAHGKGWICSDCLSAVKRETVKLVEDFLIPDFGFSSNEIAINFSGNRGYHVHVKNRDVVPLDNDARKEISNYIAGVGIDLKEFFPTSGMKGKMLSGPRPTDSGWRGKLARNFVRTLDKGVDALADIGIERTIAKRLYKNKSLVELGINNGNWDMVYIKNKGEFWNVILGNQAVAQSDRIDKNVTNDPSHLIRLPDSLHGETGLIAKKVGMLPALEKFDPMVDAIAFRSGEIKVKAETRNAIEMNGMSFGPFKNEEIKLPMYAGMYLYLKGFAEIEGDHSAQNV